MRKAASSRRFTHDVNLNTGLCLAGLLLFFGVFLFYPVGFMLRRAFGQEGEFTLRYFGLLLSSPLHQESLRNTFVLAFLTTVLTTVLPVPLAHIVTRFTSTGRTLLN